jgi:beta-N-acetylhexosaminidase
VFARIYPAAAARGSRAAWLGARLIAADLFALGIDVDCLPLADVPIDGADAVIGDRAYGTSPQQVAALAGAVADGLLEGGVLPVLKHLPGHGRANVDSHHKLPVVAASRDTLEATDFAAFRPLGQLPLGMTAHGVFTSIDPGAPATTSATIIADVIRDSVGFSGALMSDDISMGALTGTIAERTRAAVAAGCDLVLHCNGRLDEMRAVATEVPELAGRAGERAARALAARRRPGDIDLAAARAEFAVLIAQPAPGEQVS